MVSVEFTWVAEQPFRPGSTQTAIAIITSMAEQERYFFAQLIFAGSALNLGPMDLLLQPGETMQLSKAIKMPDVVGEYPCQVLVLVYGLPPEPFWQDLYIDVGAVTIAGVPEKKFNRWWLAPIPIAAIGAVAIAARRKR